MLQKKISLKTFLYISPGINYKFMCRLNFFSIPTLQLEHNQCDFPRETFALANIQIFPSEPHPVAAIVNRMMNSDDRERILRISILI